MNYNYAKKITKNFIINGIRFNPKDLTSDDWVEKSFAIESKKLNVLKRIRNLSWKNYRGFMVLTSIGLITQDEFNEAEYIIYMKEDLALIPESKTLYQRADDSYAMYLEDISLIRMTAGKFDSKKKRKTVIELRDHEVDSNLEVNLNPHFRLIFKTMKAFNRNRDIFSKKINSDCLHELSHLIPTFEDYDFIMCSDNVTEGVFPILKNFEEYRFPRIIKHDENYFIQTEKITDCIHDQSIYWKVNDFKLFKSILKKSIDSSIDLDFTESLDNFSDMSSSEIYNNSINIETLRYRDTFSISL